MAPSKSIRGAFPTDRARVRNQAIVPFQPTMQEQQHSSSDTRSDIRSTSPRRRVDDPPRPRSRSVKTSQTHQAQSGDRQKPRRNRQLSQPRPHRVISPFIQGVRLVILGVGIWAIAGTALSVWNPASRHPSQVSPPVPQTSDQNPAYSQAFGADGTVNPFSLLQPGQEMRGLAAQVAPLTQGITDLTPGIYLVDLDNGDYFSLNGDASFSAASMIKVPVLIAFFQDVDAGKIRLDEILTMQEGDLAEGSGDMQFDGVGSQYTALETATYMITISDNTATNMLIRRMGGIEAMNQRFRQWGLQQTVFRNLLPDLEGTNMTSPKELSILMARVSQGDLMSIKSRDRLLDIMQQTVTDTLLPTSLTPGATISHKTGDIGSLVGDTGLIDMPNGKRYAITAMVKRPHNDDRAQELIRQIATTVYGYLEQSMGTPSSPVASPDSEVSPTATDVSPESPEVSPVETEGETR
ncbi:MAG: serine hydrolase [Cyanobacteria bacterium CRU_2_1]|nr:serine hydrolase [Cyanobacteria bacterium RU_5_0]NJR62797.1 serine hydrolase [Cyanobacteria bacterium CRU_2_1]